MAVRIDELGVPENRRTPPARCARTIALVAVTALMLLPAIARAAAPGDTLGVYAGAGSPSAVAAFETQIGRPVAMVHDALARESWADLSNPTWFVEQWAASSYSRRVMYSVPMLPDSGGTLAEGATGAYNEYFRTLALRLVAGGDGSAILRIGPEFNGNWFRWSIAAPGGGADFAAFWRQIVTTMRAVPGADFKFDWCANGGSSYVDGQQLQAESAYPGDAYVDYVGLDVYDQSWSPNRADPAARWKEFVNQRNGLSWHRDFAAAHGKPMTFPEWGLANRSDGYGGGDAPYFIEQMYEWIRTNDVAYHMYFQYGDRNADYALFSDWAPNASRRFVELFGADAADAPLAPPPAPAATESAPPAGGADPATSPAPAAAADAGSAVGQDVSPAPPPGGAPPPTSPSPTAAGNAGISSTPKKPKKTSRARKGRCTKMARRVGTSRRGRTSRRASRASTCSKRRVRRARPRRFARVARPSRAPSGRIARPSP